MQMQTKRLEEILSRFSCTKVAVLGDFFLDLYIQMERALSEFSIETHKEAFQAVGLRGQPGAAGVVTNNLAALGAQHSVIAYIGQDGNGLTLKNALQERGADISHLIDTDDRFTPTYTKPMMKELDGSNIELNRIDIINRSPNPDPVNVLLAHHLEEAVTANDGILVVEQVRHDGFGVMSPLLRRTLSDLAVQYPEKIIMVDSRHFASDYQGVSLKMNIHEAAVAVAQIDNQFTPSENEINDHLAENIAEFLWLRHKRPVFITLGEHGICGVDQGQFFHVPGFNHQGPIDIVGAGDSVLAGVGLALCAGATPWEAAYIGNLVGSITVQQLGTTGIATQADLLNRHQAYQGQNKGK
jgi:rfaE bifunctional protein kinase chain/domain